MLQAEPSLTASDVDTLEGNALIVKPYAILLKAIKIGKKLWQIACNLPNLPKFFTVNIFYCTVYHDGSL